MFINPKNISLVIFTSEGREHLLYDTINSFNNACNYQFSKKILSIDGRINYDVNNTVKPDIIVQHYDRQGYIKSIITVLKLIETPYFFWLEDDFLFNLPVPVDYLLETMTKDGTWAGIFLSRTAPLTLSEKKYHYFDDLYLPDYGFSVSPTLCKTMHIKNAFEALISYPKNDSTKHYGFEPFINDFFKQNKLKYALLDPGAQSHVEHIGFMESTAREYHMINSVDKKYSAINKKYISGFGKERVITSYNKLAMLPKLWFAVFILSFKLLKQRQAYDFAFRIYCAFLRKFKY